MDQQFGPLAPRSAKDQLDGPAGATHCGECRQNPCTPGGANETTGRESQLSKAEWLFHLLADQPQVSLDQKEANQNDINQHVGLGGSAHGSPITHPGTCGPQWPSGLWAQKMTPEDDPEAFINAFERIAVVAGWPPAQWSTILILCLISSAQQAVGTLPLQDLPDFQKVKRAVLQTLNLILEASGSNSEKSSSGLSTRTGS